MSSIQEMLRFLVDHRGSDLHIKAAAPPFVRIDGVLHAISAERLMSKDTESLMRSVMNEKQWKEFEEIREADFAITIADIGRFRVNAFRQRGSVAGVFRRVLPGVPSMEVLGLPSVVRRLAEERRGLVLVTGATGSGKTTTLASMIDAINSSRCLHIMTIEDPIEILHPDKRSIVNQREIGLDTEDWRTAVRRAMRQDPDVILIGEMRDPETVWAALTAAETGHLVLSTLHTSDAVETINRIIDVFPPAQQRQVRVSLASNLRGVLTQRLLERADGKGRIPAVEALVVTGRASDRIMDEEKTHEIYDVIAEGSFYGMQTFEQALLDLYARGLVTYSEALAAATRPHDFKVAVQQAGLPAGDMDAAALEAFQALDDAAAPQSLPMVPAVSVASR